MESHSIRYPAKALLLSQTGRQGKAGENPSPRESGAADAGLRRESLSPHSKTLSRSFDPYCMVTACAGEAGVNVGSSPTDPIRLFGIEDCIRDEAARWNPKARCRLNS